MVATNMQQVSSSASGSKFRSTMGQDRFDVGPVALDWWNGLALSPRLRLQRHAVLCRNSAVWPHGAAFPAPSVEAQAVSALAAALDGVRRDPGALALALALPLAYVQRDAPDEQFWTQASRRTIEGVGTDTLWKARRLRDVSRAYIQVVTHIPDMAVNVGDLARVLYASAQGSRVLWG